MNERQTDNKLRCYLILDVQNDCNFVCWRQAYRESTGTISTTDGSISDPVSAAEENAFCKACARFGLGLYLYHDDQTTSM
jgi:hypothetical protein